MKQNTDSLANLKCPICENADQSLFAIRYKKTDFAVVECHKCRFGFIPTEPKSQSADYSHYKDKSTAEEVKRGNQWLKIQVNLDRYSLIQRFKPKGRILDVGAGWGHFVLAGRQTPFEVTGIEVSTENYNFAVNELGLDIRNVSFYDLTEISAYDIVTMWDVLEHIDNPERFIRKTHSVLKDNGIVVIKVPRGDAIIAKLLGKNWWHLGPGHVNYFSISTISRLLTKSGFQIIEAKTTIEPKNILLNGVVPLLKRFKRSANNVTPAESQRSFNKLTDRPDWVLKLLMWSHRLLLRIVRVTGIGDEILIIGQKKL